MIAVAEVRIVTAATAGVVAGAVAGNNIKGISKTEGAVVGAVLLGLISGAIGNQQDVMERQNASVNQHLNSAEQQANTAVANSNGSKNAGRASPIE